MIRAATLACAAYWVLGTPYCSAADPGYDNTVAPFLAAYCTTCHGGDKPKGEFRTDTALATDFADPATRDRWKEVVNVLNSHEMPPKTAKRQPPAAEVAKVVDWITDQAVKVELARRDRGAVLRRLNREEYRNTIRDLIGLDFDVSGFPADPPAGGFDNNGSALTVSPLHVETYLTAARHILDRALVEGDRPPAVKWRFVPKVGPGDRTRQRLDARNNPIVNGSNNRQEGDWVVVHHDSWDKSIGARDFRVPTAGTYIIRLHAAGRTPTREQVVATADAILTKRQAESDQRNPKSAHHHKNQYEQDRKHFATDRMYEYGPPRVKLTLQLGPQPRTVAEFDVTGSPAAPSVHEYHTRFTTESAGVHFEYAYDIPRVLENFWLQGRDEFARPELMIDWFEVEGPVFDAWPPTAHTNILFDSPKRMSDEAGYAKDVLARFLRRAYRRPVSDDEVTSKLRFYTVARADGAGFVEAIKRSLVAVLTSPHFLYLVEPAGDAATPRKLTDHELAARLSYFLWSSTPDDELSKLADTGRLRAELATQTDRLLADPKAAAFTSHFAGQWLGLREVGTNPPAPDLYPRYDRHLETSIVGESEAFFREILVHDLPVTNFIRSDFVTVNERLARFYGIPGVKGDHFRRVPVPAGVSRGGIVTQASVLSITSNGTRTSPVKRGTWVMKTLLGIDPGLPVANAGEIAPKVPGIDKATVRKRLEIHRQLDQCARCHNKIDPLGFALENYNAAGEWREQEGFGYKGRILENDPRIDARSEMLDGTPIVGVAGLQQAMLAREELFLSCLASKLMTYALGRELGLADQPAVKAAAAGMMSDGKTLRGLVRRIVTSPEFGTK